MTATSDSGWFDTARFGLFVHFGHFSSQGWEPSWPLVGGLHVFPHCQDIAVEEYHANARGFAPRRGSPRDWLARARRAGMGYAVLTTKHHDGFALFPSKHSTYSIAHSSYDGDLVGEFVEATRAEGLRVGFYFSLPDWHHPDYPAKTEADKPYASSMFRRGTPEQWQRYVDFLFAQLRELLTNYGKIDLLWFDGGWERTVEEWRSSELEAMIRSLQPDIVINDRLPGVGDYETPEQFVPATPPERRWETCLTMNESWGWNPADVDYKSARQLVHSLCEVAGRGGNLLLNIGPRGDGSLAPEQAERLDAITAWMERNGESILGSSAGLAAWQFYGPSTRKGNRVFLHCLMRPYDVVTVRGIELRRVRGVRHLATGTALSYSTRATVIDRLARNSRAVGELWIECPERLVDPLATVIELELDGTA